MKRSFKNKHLFYGSLYVLIDVFAFGSSYFHKEIGGIGFILLLNLAISIIICLNLSTSLFKKLVFILVAALLNTFIGVILIASTMFIPGSKEHNYIMNNVCIPAIKKHYGLPANEPFPASEVDKNGFDKFWYQHSECEKNIYEGKGPVFTENPSEFSPKPK